MSESGKLPVPLPPESTTSRPRSHDKCSRRSTCSTRWPANTQSMVPAPPGKEVPQELPALPTAATAKEPEGQPQVPGTHLETYHREDSGHTTKLHHWSTNLGQLGPYNQTYLSFLDNLFHKHHQYQETTPHRNYLHHHKDYLMRSDELPLLHSTTGTRRKRRPQGLPALPTTPTVEAATAEETTCEDRGQRGGPRHVTKLRHRLATYDQTCLSLLSNFIYKHYL